MRARWGVAVATVAAIASLLTGQPEPCGPSVTDSAHALGTSTRLDGAVAALERLEVATRLTTVPGVDPVAPAVDDLAQRCGGGPVLVVAANPVTGEVAAAGLPSGSPIAQAARAVQPAAQPLVHIDPAAAVAHGLEAAWRELEQVPDDQRGRGDALVSDSLGALRRRVAAGVRRLVFSLAGVAAVGALIQAARRRRARRTARSALHQARQELAVAYVDLDEVLAAAVLRYDTITRGLPPGRAAGLAGALIEHLDRVDAATRRAEACLLAYMPRRLSRQGLHAAAVAHDDARTDLRAAVEAVQELVDTAAGGAASEGGALRTGYPATTVDTCEAQFVAKHPVTRRV